MPTLRFKNCGKARAGLLKAPFHRCQYYPEYRKIEEKDNPTAPTYVPVEDDDIYAPEIICLEGFEMDIYTHIKARLFHPGLRTGPVVMPKSDYRDEPSYDGTTGTKLAAEMAIRLVQRGSCVIRGVRRKGMNFAVKSLNIGNLTPVSFPVLTYFC